MWTDDLRWAWKLRDQKRQQEKENSECNSKTTEKNKEVWKMYAADLGSEICQNDEEQIVTSKCTQQSLVTWLLHSRNGEKFLATSWIARFGITRSYAKGPGSWKTDGNHKSRRNARIEMFLSMYSRGTAMLPITQYIVKCTSQTEDQEMVGTRVAHCVLCGPPSTAAF